MAESTGKTGRGVFIQIESSLSPTTWVTVGNVSGITPSGKNAEEIDFTHLLSEGGFREFRQGFKDPGTIGINYHFDPTDASHVDMLEHFNDGSNFNWRINFSGAGWAKYLQGAGFIQNPGDLDINVDGPIAGTATIRVTGETTFEDI